jgi:hypothetical protein
VQALQAAGTISRHYRTPGVVVNVDSEGHGELLHHLGALISSAARPPIMKAGALVGPEMIDGICRAQTAKAVDAKFAVHFSIGAGADLGGAHRMTETGRGSPREVDKVLSADGFEARNGLSCTDAVEGSLAAREPLRSPAQ